jgi:hypothetical protein
MPHRTIEESARRCTAPERSPLEIQSGYGSPYPCVVYASSGWPEIGTRCPEQVTLTAIVIKGWNIRNEPPAAGLSADPCGRCADRLIGVWHTSRNEMRLGHGDVAAAKEVAATQHPEGAVDVGAVS